MKATIIIKIDIDPRSGNKITLQAVPEDGMPHGPRFITNEWDKFKSITIENIVNVHAMINALNEIPFGEIHVNTESMLIHQVKLDREKLSAMMINKLIKSICVDS